MRRALDLLYGLSGALAALFLAAICGIVLLQVGANAVNALASAVTGRSAGLVVPSYAHFAGWFLAATSFLALAHTLRHGAHIRVVVAIQGVRGRPRRVLEAVVVAVGLALAAFFTWHSYGLVAESLRFGDVSSGLVRVPLWIPQSAVALGLTVLAIALADDLVAILRGRRPSYEPEPLWEEGE